MSTEDINISNEEIENFLESSLEKKIEITSRLGHYYTSMNIAEKKKKVVERLFRGISKDTEVKVRKTLAESIKLSSDIPSDIVIQLAKDINEVSIPVLEFSDVISDEDLINIITESNNLVKQKSIAKRRVVSKAVSNKLIETNQADVIKGLLKNSGSEINLKDYEDIIDKFSDNINIIESVIVRDAVAPDIIENIANKVSNEIYSSLLKKHSLILKDLDNVIGKSKNIVNMKAIGLKSSENEFYNFQIEIIIGFCSIKNGN